MPLRLDPRHPPLWRTPTAGQFGADAVAVVEADQPWHTRLLAVLEEGLPAEHAVRVAGAMGAPAAEAVEFLAAIAPALRDDDAPAGEQVMLRVSGAVRLRGRPRRSRRRGRSDRRPRSRAPDRRGLPRAGSARDGAADGG